MRSLDCAPTGMVSGRVDDADERRQASRAVGVSALGLAVTRLVELVIALVTGSVGLLGDALHNLSDVSTSLVVILGFRISRRAASERYLYGLERAEGLAGLRVAVVIWASAVFAGIATKAPVTSQPVSPRPGSWMGTLRPPRVTEPRSLPCRTPVRFESCLPFARTPRTTLASIIGLHHPQPGAYGHRQQAHANIGDDLADHHQHKLRYCQRPHGSIDRLIVLFLSGPLSLNRVDLAVAQRLPHGRHQAGDRHLKFHHVRGQR
jgi:Cation efflux family